MQIIFIGDTMHEMPLFSGNNKKNIQNVVC